MKIAAIIAEYNPFHNGHRYHIQQTRLLTGADYILVVMSGDFVQRGAPALCNKYIRTKMALLEGADAVLELPALYSLSSAEYFAGGSITLLNQLGVIDYLSFGSEQGSVSPFLSCAAQLLKQDFACSETLLAQLRQGKSYPCARQNALQSDATQNTSELGTLLCAPNNILGLEYCKSLLATKSSIEPVTIPRADCAYHARTLSLSDVPLSSASAIRKEIEQGNIRLENHLPEKIYALIQENQIFTNYITTNDFSSLLQYKLLSESENGFCKYLDCTQDISNKIKKNINYFKDFDSFCISLKSKDLTYTRISRVLMHILLNITAPDIYSQPLKERQLAVPYARLLGFRSCAGEMLSVVKHNTSIPLISKPADAHKFLDSAGISMLNKDIFCANVYETVFYQKKHKHQTTIGPEHPVSFYNDIKCSPVVM